MEEYGFLQDSSTNAMIQLAKIAAGIAQQASKFIYGTLPSQLYH
jgi:hypothetical protein